MAPCYDRHATQQKHTLETLVDGVLPYTKTGAWVLDAGCGTGYLQSCLAARGLAWRVYGVDVSAAMCAIARSLMPAVACADLTSLPIADASMDMVFSSSAMQWVGSLDAAYEEANRVLALEGVIAIAVYVDGTLRELHEAMKQAGWPVWRFAHEQDHLQALEVAGFKIDQVNIEDSKQLGSSLHDLLRSLKNIGANRYYPATQPTMKLQLFRQIERYYDQHFRQDGASYASWRIAYLIARKKAGLS